MAAVRSAIRSGEHFFNEQASPDNILRGTLETYNGPNRPPKPPAPGSVPDPISDFIKAGHWKPAEKAQASMVKEFKKENAID